MSRNRLIFFCGIAISVTLAAASCSRPTESTQNTKPLPATSAVDTSSKDAAAAPAARDERQSEEPKKQELEPSRPAPVRHSTPTPPPPAPIAAPAPPASAASAPPPLPQVTPPVPAPLPQPSAPIPVTPIPVPEPTTKQVTIPSGTQLYVRLIDSVSSDKNHTGDSIRASVDSPVVVDNVTIIPKRADVVLKLTDVESAGKLSGTSVLKVQMDRIVIGRKSYDVVSNIYEQSGESEGKKAARNVGIGAAVGGILGGILGGGKGAVIGAGAGGGGGAIISKGEQMRLDSETQLVFRLENPLDVTFTAAPPAASRFSTTGGSGPATLTPPPDQPTLQRPSSRSSSNSSDISGTWTVTTDGPQGSTLQLVIRQNGNNLQGSISNPTGYGTLPIYGSVNGNYVTFSTQSQSQYGTNAAMQFTGAVQGDGMQGMVTMPAAAANAGYGGIGGYPGGGRNGRNRTDTARVIQARWNAQRNN